MNESNCKKSMIRFIVAYVWTLALALYFTKGIEGSPPAYLSVLALGALGLILSIVFSLLAGKNPNNNTQAWLLFTLFSILQGGLGFLVERYAFNYSTLPSLDYAMGALVGLLIFWSQRSGLPRLLASLLTVVFIGLGLGIALRLGETLAGLFFTLALLNSYWLFRKLFSNSETEQSNIEAIILAVVLLGTGRAIIQYYLLQSNYANLGVVVTHPYTFVALFAGFLLPLAFVQVEKENYLPAAVWVGLLGALFPFVAGLFIHVRPMAGYLLGLVVSSFLVAILVSRSFYLHLLTYLSLIVTALSLPIFSQLSNMTRMVRLGVLGGCLLVALLILLLIRTRDATKTASA